MGFRWLLLNLMDMYARWWCAWADAKSDGFGIIKSMPHAHVTVEKSIRFDWWPEQILKL